MEKSQDQGKDIKLYILDQYLKTGSKLCQLKMVQIVKSTKKPKGIVLNPYAQVAFSKNDEEIMKTNGLVAVDCTWNIKNKNVEIQSTYENERYLPYMIAANSRSKGIAYELCIAEAFAAALLICGYRQKADQILTKFSFGQQFLSLNNKIISQYQKCQSAAMIQQMEEEIEKTCVPKDIKEFQDVDSKYDKPELIQYQYIKNSDGHYDFEYEEDVYEDIANNEDFDQNELEEEQEEEEEEDDDDDEDDDYDDEDEEGGSGGNKIDQMYKWKARSKLKDYINSKSDKRKEFEKEKKLRKAKTTMAPLTQTQGVIADTQQQKVVQQSGAIQQQQGVTNNTQQQQQQQQPLDQKAEELKKIQQDLLDIQKLQINQTKKKTRPYNPFLKRQKKKVQNPNQQTLSSGTSQQQQSQQSLLPQQPDKVNQSIRKSPTMNTNQKKAD